MLNKVAARLSAIAGLMLAGTLATGCLSLSQESEKAETNTAIRLRPEAKALAGAGIRSLLVEATQPEVDVPLSSRTIRGVVDKSRGAVVSIYVRTNTPYRLKLKPISVFGGVPVTVPGVGLGSGFFIHPSGYALTNNHVIEDAEQITIQTTDGKDHAVHVIARDPVYDLALLKVNAADGRLFSALPMGDSNQAAAGDMVLAVGNPLGLGHTVTSGIVSQTGRSLTNDAKNEGRHVEYIQTDTAINPGSSGGPLITLNGNWIAVNTAGITEAQGLGFSVPSAQARSFLQSVIAGKGDLETP